MSPASILAPRGPDGTRAPRHIPRPPACPTVLHVRAPNTAAPTAGGVIFHGLHDGYLSDADVLECGLEMARSAGGREADVLHRLLELAQLGARMEMER